MIEKNIPVIMVIIAIINNTFLNRLVRVCSKDLTFFFSLIFVARNKLYNMLAKPAAASNKPIIRKGEKKIFTIYFLNHGGTKALSSTGVLCISVLLCLCGYFLIK